ncbi:hypothetical protein, partial [Candidatus Amarolinea dominans]|uniref:hypothetical protein n=1 Tax=Candidatus Amarolinea dominans TaxID=3140696 RepID=UPI0031CC3D3B
SIVFYHERVFVISHSLWHYRATTNTWLALHCGALLGCNRAGRTLIGSGSRTRAGIETKCFRGSFTGTASQDRQKPNPMRRIAPITGHRLEDYAIVGRCAQC